MKFLAAILALIVSANASAALKGAPFLPEEDARFDVLENDTGANTANVAIARKYAKAVYDVSISGGSSAAKSLSAVLPAGAVITKFLVYINTPFVEGSGAGTSSLAFQCAGTADLMANQGISTWPLASYVARSLGNGTAYGAAQLIASGASPAIQGIGSSVASACTVTAVPTSTIGTTSFASGKATLIIDYFIK